jgi:hypothetical protein
MALSGNISVPVSEHTTLVFLWTATQNVQTNSSDVAWEMQLVTDSIGNIQATPGSAYRVTVDGQPFNGTTDVSIGTNSTKTLASGVVTMVHNEDGNRGFDFSFEQDFYITIVTNGAYVGVVSGSGTGVLDRIVAEEPEPDPEPEPEEPEDPDVPDEPDVPNAEVIANRKRSTIIGYLLDLVGKPLPLASKKEPVAYLYNGVRLPELPEVEGYPYAFILLANTETVNYTDLCFTTSPCLITNVLNTPVAQASETLEHIKFTLNGNAWEIAKSGTIESGKSVHSGATYMIWANYDVMWRNSSEVYFSASAPIPVYE